MTNTLTTSADAEALLTLLAADHDEVSVYWDRGWGHNGAAEISIVTDGNGRTPHAYITPEVYTDLIRREVVGGNSLMTAKDRRVHDFKSRPRAVRTGPTTGEVAETVIRAIFAGLPSEPLRAEFFRGVQRGPHGLQVRYEVVTTPACGREYFVGLHVGSSDVAISAVGQHDRISTDLIDAVVCVSYPVDEQRSVDLVALAGPQFRSELAAAIADKLAVVASAVAAEEKLIDYARGVRDERG